MIVTHEISLDIKKNNSIMVQIPQYNKDTHKLVVTLTDNGQPFILPTQDYDAWLKVAGYGGNYYQEAMEFSTENNTVSITLPESLVSFSGKHHAQIDIKHPTTHEQISTLPFYIKVPESVYTDNVVLKVYDFGELNRLIDNANQRLADIRASIVAGNEAIERINTNFDTWQQESSSALNTFNTNAQTALDAFSNENETGSADQLLSNIRSEADTLKTTINGEATTQRTNIETAASDQRGDIQDAADAQYTAIQTRADEVINAALTANNSNIVNGTATGSLRSVGSVEENVANHYYVSYGSYTNYQTKTIDLADMVTEIPSSDYDKITKVELGVSGAGVVHVYETDTSIQGKCDYSVNGSVLTFQYPQGTDPNPSGPHLNKSGVYLWITIGEDSALGSNAFAIGYQTKAVGDYAHAQNQGTVASSNSQTALGKYNVEDQNNIYAVIVGNGTENLFSNAFTIDWQGNVVASGTLTYQRRIYKDVQTLTAGTVSAITFSPTGYTYDTDDEYFLEIYLNGLKLNANEYTATYANSVITVTFTTPITAGNSDVIEMVLRK